MRGRQRGGEGGRARAAAATAAAARRQRGREREADEAGDVRLSWSAPQRRVAPGQSVVLYDGDEVVGGGLVAR